MVAEGRGGVDAPEGVGCAAAGQDFTQSDRWGGLMHFCRLASTDGVRKTTSKCIGFDQWTRMAPLKGNGVLVRGLAWAQQAMRSGRDEAPRREMAR